MATFRENMNVPVSICARDETRKRVFGSMGRIMG